MLHKSATNTQVIAHQLYSYLLVRALHEGVCACVIKYGTKVATKTRMIAHQLYSYLLVRALYGGVYGCMTGVSRVCSSCLD